MNYLSSILFKVPVIVALVLNIFSNNLIVNIIALLIAIAIYSYYYIAKLAKVNKDNVIGFLDYLPFAILVFAFIIFTIILRFDYLSVGFRNIFGTTIYGGFTVLFVVYMLNKREVKS